MFQETEEEWTRGQVVTLEGKSYTLKSFDEKAFVLKNKDEEVIINMDEKDML